MNTTLSTSRMRPQDFVALISLSVLLLIGFCWQIFYEPIRGEESRWSHGATIMLATGDWIVPRQQGEVFPERPPLNSWLIAAIAWATGSMNPLATRLPSVLATLLTSLWIYRYARTFLPIRYAFIAAGIFATFGQVLQLGRLGESEAVLTLFIAGSLFEWHRAFVLSKSTDNVSQQGSYQLWGWMIGFFLAGLAALTKGLQGPVYFVGITILFCLLNREWKWLFNWRAFVGCVVMLVTISAWCVPFVLSTDLESLRAVWTGLIQDRMTLGGLGQHAVSYPIETIGCLLPWSLLLVQLLYKDVRRGILDSHGLLLFLLVALFVSYPSVLLVTGARGRYYMPLYPVIAVLFAIIVRASEQSIQKIVANGFVRLEKMIALATLFGGIVVAFSESSLLAARIPWEFSLSQVVLYSSLLCVTGLFGLFRERITAGFFGTGSDIESQKYSPSTSVLSLLFVYAFVAIPLFTKHGDHVRELTTELKHQLPPNTELFSYGPVHHRFMYHWQAPIQQLPWPSDLEHAVRLGDYFCIDLNKADTDQVKVLGRGRSWTTVQGKLPFVWEEVARIPVDRELNDSHNWIVIGKFAKPEEVALRDRKTDERSIR